jgi:hypothetical protein
MAKAYVDTTVLTNALLKPSTQAPAALKALSRYNETLLPAYAIKEFKAGPLRAYAYVHNVLSDTGSISASLDRINALFRQRNLQSTCMDALSQAASQHTGSLTVADLEAKYGRAAQIDSVLADSYRLSIKTLIFLAWRKRRRLTTGVSEELSCYDEREPVIERGQIDLKPKECHSDCCLARLMKEAPEKIEALREATESQQPSKAELNKRAKALRQLIRKPKSEVSNEVCRHLGDAIFAFFAPDDSVILTTNKADHEQLASALGKKVDTP